MASFTYFYLVNPIFSKFSNVSLSSVGRNIFPLAEWHRPLVVDEFFISSGWFFSDILERCSRPRPRATGLGPSSRAVAASVSAAPAPRRAVLVVVVVVDVVVVVVVVVDVVTVVA